MSQPRRTRQFKSSSGRTVLQYFTHLSSPGDPDFRGFINTAPGFEQAEVLLCGFRLKADQSAEQVSTLAAAVRKFSYDPGTGVLDVGVSPRFITVSGQFFSAKTTFVVVLTDGAAAKFTTVSTGCSASSQCTILREFGNAVPATPPALELIGIATRSCELGLPTGPISAIPLNAVACGRSAFSLSKPTVLIEVVCALRDGDWTNEMFCEWEGVVIAFDPTEMIQVHGFQPNEYTILGRAAGRRVVPDFLPLPATPVTGVLNALEGFALFFDPNRGGPDFPIWMVEASASAPQVGATAATNQYGLFLGAEFERTARTEPYWFQLWRTVGFLL